MQFQITLSLRRLGRPMAACVIAFAMMSGCALIDNAPQSPGAGDENNDNAITNDNGTESIGGEHVSGPAATWSLSDRVAGAQLSNHNRRWSVGWLLLDSMRWAADRDDLGGIIAPTARGGRMVLLYTGERPEYEDWGQEARVNVDQRSVELISESPGRMLFSLPPDSQLFLRTTEPVENFVLVPEEYEDSYQDLLWYPELVEKVSQGAVLRAIQLQQLNWWYQDSATAELHFDQRPLPTDKLQSTQDGFSIELLVDLANRAGTDFWYAIPERAPDDYARSMARVIERELDTERRVFFECGNEIWNSISPYAAQTEWMTAEADRRGLFQDLDTYARALMMHALRTVELGAIFEEVLGEERVVVVLAQQVGMAYFHDMAAERLGDRADEVEALAIAPYFGAAAQEHLGNADDQTIFDAIDVDLDDVLQEIANSAASASRHGWPLIAYEGGQHMVAPGGWEATDEAREQLQRVNESPEMGAFYARWLDGWSEAGGGLMMHYGLVYQQDGMWGAWGLYDHTDQGPTEKSRAFFEWATYPAE